MPEQAPILYVTGENQFTADLVAAALRPHYSVTTAVDDVCGEKEKANIAVAFAGRPEEATVLVQSIKRLLPEARIIIVGCGFAEERCVRLIELGVRAFVGPEERVGTLLATVEAVHRGNALCSEQITSLVFERLAALSRTQPFPAPAILTIREAEIFALVREGLSNKEIAHRLCISVSTVKNHVHRILEKLQIRKRCQALDWGFSPVNSARPTKSSAAHNPNLS
jgi:DNA-binding NarL/FixJ family response regulator